MQILMRCSEVYFFPTTQPASNLVPLSARQRIAIRMAFRSRAGRYTQVNRMSRSRRVLAIGGKQRILRLDMVCIETILFHLDSL